MRYGLILLIICFECASPEKTNDGMVSESNPYLIVLGNVQDAGSPQAACTKDCCKDLFENPDPDRMVVSLGLVDPKSKSSWLFEATPDLPRQMKMLAKAAGGDSETPDGIFLTHGHIGHYAGLMFLGHESMSADNLPVYAMPRMNNYLQENGPWSQLVEFNNIAIQLLSNDSIVALTKSLSVAPFIIPHRDEFSETVGYKITGSSKSALFIPDIDKWRKWETDIVTEIAKVDYAFLDATFFDNNEVNRDMAEIGHPFVVESLALFENLLAGEKAKVYFIHFNHTNPLLNPESEESKLVSEKGYNIARVSTKLEL